MFGIFSHIMEFFSMYSTYLVSLSVVFEHLPDFDVYRSLCNFKYFYLYFTE